MSKRIIQMTAIAPSGQQMIVHIHRTIAWPAARGIAVDSHCDVILVGEFGTAYFFRDGSGNVMWNEKSTTPGETTRFDERTTVCI